MATDSRMILANDLIKAICEAMSLDANRVRRIIIDAEVSNKVLVYIEQIGDDRLFQIDWPGHLKDAQIKQVDK